MKDAGLGLLAGLLAACAASSVRAQVPSQHGRIPPVLREPEYPETTPEPRERKNSFVLPSDAPEFGEDPTRRSTGVIGRVPPELPRLPDGYVIARRPARVERPGDWYVLHVADVEGLPAAPPLRVLPNERLGLLETVLEGRERPPAFVVTGRITEFSGVNYVLIEALRERSAPTTPSPTPDVPPPAATEPAFAVTQPAHEPTAEEVVRRLMQAQPRRALMPSAATQPGEAARGVGETPSAREEALLIDRAGRLIPGEPWWTFVFEDLGSAPQTGPIRVLPSQLLETAIHLSRGGTGGIVLIISGEVTVHKNVEYLLLRKVLVRRDLGNFR